jgi:hypothetical protein
MEKLYEESVIPVNYYSAVSPLFVQSETAFSFSKRKELDERE